MTSYRSVLAKLFKDAGLRQADVAARMGYKSASAIGMMLSGERNIGLKELEQMCEIAGISLIELATQSDGLNLTNSKTVLIAAEIMDSLPEELQEDALTMLKAMKARVKHFGL